MSEPQTTAAAEATSAPEPPAPSGAERHVDEDAQTMLVESLRAQCQDLFTQVTQLNGKLVQSYGRVADLEDDLHVSSQSLRNHSLKISQLELERAQHLSALNTGLLVEKSHVTSELSRLMERATEEAARRGQAESARAEIEKDLDDLSANLFGQANTMVAQARIGQAISERKVTEAEQALRGAEDAVALMQQQMQDLQADKERALAVAEQMRARMGKGKWIDREPTPPTIGKLRLMSSHTPYQEFLLFVAHLRSIRPASIAPPAISTLLPLPLLARLQAEDSDPTVRLDLAPSLNWLSRRSVLSAIHNGELNIEPMSALQLMHELAPSMTSLIPGANTSTVSCALCGTSIFPANPSAHHRHAPPQHPRTRTTSSSSVWLGGFKNPLAAAAASSTSTVNTDSPLPSPPLEPTVATGPVQVYIFRLAVQNSGLPSLPLGQPQSPTAARPAQIYPLCSNGWCLRRLRATCSLWAFVRIALVEKIWEEETPGAPMSRDTSNGSTGSMTIHAPVPQRAALGAPPPVPPRRKSKMGMSGLWNALGAIANGNTSPATAPPTPEKKAKVQEERALPPPPPPRAHPITPPRSEKTTPTPAPPPIPRRSASREARVSGEFQRAESTSTPPPIPRRSESRGDLRTSASGEIQPAATPPPIPRRSVTRKEVPTLTRERALSIVESVDERSIKSAVIDKEGGLDKTASALSADGDEFETPPEELASNPLSRVVSQDAEPAHIEPASIPLPESVAGTPIQAVFPAGAGIPKDDAPVSASGTASPAPAVDGTSAPGSRTGSPAPPPLPRRAAARGSRPLSAIASAEPIVAAPVEEPAPTEKGDETAKDETETPAESTQIPAETLAEPVTDGPPIPPTSQGIPTRDSMPGEDVSLSGDAAHALAAERVEDAKLVPSVEDAKPVPPLTERRDSADNEQDGEVYVGEATWEERAWKELVRLREDMFWARVGGLR